MSAYVAAIIPAAGLGVRLRSGATADPSPPKALIALEGRTLVQRSIDLVAEVADQILVAVPADSVDAQGRELSGSHVVVMAGGSSRQQSVSLALAAVDAAVELVLVQDAARPLVPAAVVRRVLAALQAGATCVVPAIPVPDSLRAVADAGGSTPLDRAGVRLVQTPQGFTVDALRRGHSLASTGSATDDASLVEAAGEPVTLVEGDPLAFKITRPLDLVLAQALLRRAE